MKSKFFLGLALVISSSAFAAEPPPKVTAWVNPECATGECEVKGMKIFVRKYKDTSMGGAYMTAEMETANKDLLKKYAFVQYIEGCVFAENSKGETQLAFRENLGKKGQPFKHVGPEIDSGPDADPIYWSTSDAGFDELRGIQIYRHSGYATKNPMTNENFGSWASKDKNLDSAKLYVSDMPSWTHFTKDINFTWKAQNSSLKFKICLHKLEDIPEKTIDGKIVVPNPVHCMEWASNYAYDKRTSRIVELKDVHPFCKQI